LALGTLGWATLLDSQSFRLVEQPVPPEVAYIAPDANAAPAAALSGRVRWQGPLPMAEPIGGLIPVAGGSKWVFRPNPFVPQIRPENQGLRDVVVSLRGSDPRQARLWERPPIRIEILNDSIVSVQGDQRTSFGFARVGSELEMVSLSDGYQAIRGRGAAFFTLPMPHPNRPKQWKLNRPGRLELTSGIGQFWAAADVFLCEHPYYTLTDEQGQFQFDRVPEGSFEVVAWLRPWRIVGKDRDPETGRTVRIHRAPEPEAIQRIELKAHQTATVELVLPQSK
jgi:hypothetical protein